MTDTTDPLDPLVRLEQLVTRLERLGVHVELPAPAAVIAPYALPPTVAAGELIESAWGNAVVSYLSMLTPKSDTVVGTSQTGITTLRTTATMSIAAAPFARFAVVTGVVSVSKTVAGDGVKAHILQNGTSGVFLQSDFSSASAAFTLAKLMNFPSGQAQTVAMQVERASGTGTLTTYADGRSHRLDVLILPGTIGA